MEPIAVGYVELAKLLGCSPRKVREMTPELPHYRHGGRIFFPVEAVKAHINRKAEETLLAQKKKEGR